MIFGKSTNRCLAIALIYFAFVQTAHAEVDQKNTESKAEKQLVITETQNFKNVFYANAGPMPYIFSINFGYQRLILNSFGVIADINYGENKWQDVQNSSVSKDQDNLDLQEWFWTSSIMLRFYPEPKNLSGLYGSLITTYYQDQMGVKKGARTDSLPQIQGEVTGSKKITGIAMGIEAGYSWRFDHILLSLGVGYIFAERQNIPYEISNNGTVQQKSLSRGSGSYAFGPRITIAIGYAF